MWKYRIEEQNGVFRLRRALFGIWLWPFAAYWWHDWAIHNSRLDALRYTSLEIARNKLEETLKRDKPIIIHEVEVL